METDPKEFIDRHPDLDSRISEIRDTDFAVLHAPEDPQLYWAFLLWELERVGREPRRNEPQFGLSPEEYQHVFGRHSVDVVLSPDANARGSAYIVRNLFKPESWMRICQALLADPNTKGFHVVESDFRIAESVVAALLEDEEIDPKEFANRPEVMHAHPVWDLDVNGIKSALRVKGWRITRMRRRKRGSLVFDVRKDSDEKTGWAEEREIEAALAPYNPDPSTISISPGIFDTAFSADHKPTDPIPYRHGWVEFVKMMPDGRRDPYA